MLPDWMPKEAWDGYVEMRKAKKKPMTARAQELIISKLNGFARMGYNIAEILDESTMNCWTGVFLTKNHVAWESNRDKDRRQTIEGLTGSGNEYTIIH